MPKSNKRFPGKPHGLTLAETKKRERQVFDELVRAEAYKLLVQHSDNLVQQVMDAAFIGAAEVFHMGPGRCEAFGNATMEALHEIAALVNGDYADDRELVYAKEKVDQRLRTICGDKFDPWEVRYGRKKGPDDKS